jgi:hypothetical protein
MGSDDASSAAAAAMRIECAPWWAIIAAVFWAGARALWPERPRAAPVVATVAPMLAVKRGCGITRFARASPLIPRRA